VRDESHLDDMRTAIRGDFERLAERRGSQELMRVEDDVPEVDDAAERSEAPEPEPPPAQVPTHEISGALTLPELVEEEPLAPDPPGELVELPDVVSEPGPGVEATPVKPRSWLDRLLGRD
jgi:hypothetical protein